MWLNDSTCKKKAINAVKFPSSWESASSWDDADSHDDAKQLYNINKSKQSSDKVFKITAKTFMN